jgi:CRP-like cAMP-binding protein
MEQNLLLTAERLKLGTDLRRGWVSHGVFVIKNVPAQMYLAVSEAQARILESFDEGATVPEVLARLLRERSCPPLREFYELVVKACDAGILCSGPSRQPPRRAFTWPAFSASSRWLAPLIVVQLAAGLGLAARASTLTDAWSAPLFMFGLLCAIVTLSLGQLLAAAVLAGAGGDVYPRSPLESFAFLHPRLDLRDARLLRPAEQALVALSAKLPLALALLVALALAPAAVAPLAAAWLLVWRPWGSGLPRRLAALLGRRPPIDTDRHFRFHPNQGPQPHWRPWWRRHDWRVGACELGWAALWSVLVAHLVLHALGLGFFKSIAAAPGYWMIALPSVAAALLLVALGLLASRWRDALRQSLHGLQRRWQTHRRRRQDFVFPDTDAALLRIAAAHPLLSLLNPYDRSALVRAWRPVLLPARTLLGQDDTSSQHVGLLLSGRIRASRVLASGRHERALSLEEGDFFASSAPSIFDDEAAPLELRCATPVAAMLAPADLFRQCVIDKLGPILVHDLTYKFAFLQRLSLCAHWDAPAVARFSRLAQVAAYRDGESIVRDGEDTNWFYILYEGTAQVRRGARLLSRLKTGDFFGEISLLQNSSAVADVVAQGPVRCLQIERGAFLRFMTHNHHVALALERISSSRLGRPIFPLRAAAVGSAHPFVGEMPRRSVCSFV